MAERNVTFLIIAKDFASKTLKNVGDNTDRTTQNLRNLDKFGIGPLATAGAALGPALLPVLAGATVAAAGVGTAMLGAGAAVGVFGAVTKSVFGEVLKASQKSEALRGKISLLSREIAVANSQGDTENAGKFEKARTKALIEYRARLLELPAPMRAAVMGMDAMRTAWQGFVTTNRSPVLSLLARGMNLLALVLPRLQPLFNAGSVAAGRLMTTFERFVSGGRLDRVVAFLAARAGPALVSFGRIIANLAIGVGLLFAPVARASDGVVGGLARMSASFRTWAAAGGQAGVERILGFARDQGPGAAAAFGELARSIGTIAQAASPLAPISAAIARALGSIINSMPQPVLTALVGGFIAWNVALRASAVLLRGQLILGGLVGIYTGISAAVRGVALAENASAVATKANAVATWAMNSALLASPITWIVIGLVALAAGLIYAYKHSETFRRIVQGALQAVVGAGRAALGFFQGIPGFFSRMWASVTGAFSTATLWIANKLYQLGGWFQALPGRIGRGLAALPGVVGNLLRLTVERGAYFFAYGIGLIIRLAINLPGQIRRAIFGLIVGTALVIQATWNRAKALTLAGLNAVGAYFRSLPGKARSAVSSLWGSISGAFNTAMRNAGSLALRAVNSAVSFFRTLPGRARSAISGLPGQIRAVFSGAGSWLVSAGGDIIRGLVRGIGNMVGAAVGEARRIASSIVGGVKAGLGIGSPSRVMADEIGRWIPPGIALGLTSAMPSLLGTVRSAVGQVTSAAQASGSAVWDVAASTGAYGSASLPAGVGGRGGDTIVLQVSGALDPLAVGQQLVQILQRWARNNGKTFELAM